ncbi:MAG TPA: DUF3048 domain-containing protein [Candidatus Limnocylindria bacterium]|nr:DUF3048 domain-containing protein [Candidatus Limnocylindria bacterium]
MGNFGRSVAASGAFSGPGKSQIAVVQDEKRDQSLKITMREANADGETFSESTWLTLGPRSFNLDRAKFVVADATFDGNDDLVALFDWGEHRSTLFVFKSTGSAFMPPEQWWLGEGYLWSRARYVLAGKFSANGRDSLVVAYQNPDFELRLHHFESDGAKFTFHGSQGSYRSGPGQFDVSRMRFAVGRFTRNTGLQQIAALYQGDKERVRISLFDPSADGFALQSNVYETNEGEYDLGRASIVAADATGDYKDDLISIYGEPDGSARVHVFDAGATFRPANSWSGWASLPAVSTCAGATAALVGDWNGDRRVDLLGLAPTDGVAARSTVLRNMGGSFKLTATNEEVLCPRWPLTGMPLAGGSATKRPLYVKIDNNPTARPHYGITKADQVYEWLVEGLTTRLAAVYQSRDPDVLGSVRSVGMTDLPIVPSLGGALVYSGGGPEELMAIHYDDAVAHRYIDLRPGYGWGYRVPFRPAPYNYFTTNRLLQGAMAAAPDADQPAIVPAWDFLPPTVTDPLAGGFRDSVPATSITVPYRALFGVSYRYDEASKTYARFNNGVREIDGENGEAVAAKNIVIILTAVHFTTAFGLDPAGNPKLDMALTGTGPAIVFRDGKRVDATWTRPDIFDVFTLSTGAGEAVRLAPGQTWIHVVPNDWTIPSQ